MSRRFEITRSRRTGAPGAEIRRVLLDPGTWSAWQPEIVSARGPAPMKPGDVARGEAAMLGFRVAGHSTAEEVEEGLFVEDVIVGVRMRLRYDIVESPSSTIVTQSLQAELPGGFSGKVLSFFLKWRLRKMQRGALRNLIRLLGDGPDG